MPRGDLRLVLRKANSESPHVSRFQIEFNTAAIDRNGPLHDGEAEARSAFRACTRFVNPVKSLKHFVSVLNGDTGATILKGDEHGMVIDTHIDVDSSAGRRILHRIVQKVDQRLA